MDILKEMDKFLERKNFPGGNQEEIENMKTTTSSEIETVFKVHVVQLPSCIQLFPTPWTSACHSSLSLTISWSLPKFKSIALVMPSSSPILCTLKNIQQTKVQDKMASQNSIKNLEKS